MIQGSESCFPSFTSRFLSRKQAVTYPPAGGFGHIHQGELVKADPQTCGGITNNAAKKPFCALAAQNNSNLSLGNSQQQFTLKGCWIQHDKVNYS